MIDDMLAESHKSIVQRIPVPDVGYQLVQCLLGDRGNARQKQLPQGLCTRWKKSFDQQGKNQQPGRSHDAQTLCVLLFLILHGNWGAILDPVCHTDHLCASYDRPEKNFHLFACHRQITVV